ncbi:hypothetical protein IWW47_004144, partial [Coemansia sp. RSA 2052]
LARATLLSFATPTTQTLMTPPSRPFASRILSTASRASCPSSRCNFFPITWPRSMVSTSTSLATWQNRSLSS